MLGRVLRPVQLVLLTNRAGRPQRWVTAPLKASCSVKADRSMPGSEDSELKEQTGPMSCHRAGSRALGQPSPASETSRQRSGYGHIRVTRWPDYPGPGRRPAPAFSLYPYYLCVTRC